MQSLPELIEKTPIWFQYVVALLVLWATVLELNDKLKVTSVVRWVMYSMFPPREGWVADCPRDNDSALDPNLAWNKSLGARWSQMRAMRAGDHFTLFIKKVRRISRIRFDVSGDEERFPQKYKLEIMSNKFSIWETIGEFMGTDIKLKGSRNIYGLRVTIIEPRTKPLSFDAKPPAWSIYDIGLTQSRLFGLLKKTI